MADIGELLHPEVEFVNPPDALETGTRRGADGVQLALGNYLAGVGDADFEIEQVIERGDKVYARGRLHGIGVSRGLDIPGGGTAAIYSFRDGLIYRMEWYWDERKALAKFEDETAAG